MSPHPLDNPVCVSLTGPHRLGAVLRYPPDVCRFLHAVAANVNAIRLYEELGFRLRKTTEFAQTRVPEAQHDSGVANGG
jgi:hypothetical protein